jgi:hypothetical protein
LDPRARVVVVTISTARGMEATSSTTGFYRMVYHRKGGLLGRCQIGRV